MRFVLAVAVLSIPAAAAWGQMPDGAIADEPPRGVANAAHAVLSPPARARVKFGRSGISVAYSAPSRRKRVIFGVLEPYNKIWRAGANNATTLHTDADLTMEGFTIPKGDYTLFVWLDEKQWQLIVNKQTGQTGLEYDRKKDLGLVPMTMSHPPKTIEKFR